MSQALSITKLTSIVAGSATKLKGLGEVLLRVLSFGLDNDVISLKKDVCVSIENSEVSLAYGSRFLSKIKITGFKRLSEAPGFLQPADLASVVALTVSNLQAAKTDITLSIPKAWTIITTAELPSIVKETLSDVVSYELDRLTPLSAGEAYYDFRLLRDNGEKLTL
ncbi:MAG TPA: hypothetical protein DCP92_19640, partial [Nitrospiraceae bacterium]|nr:hypothetical protein [Nitrospiraceae bacterium]